MGRLPMMINIKTPNVNESGKCELAVLIKFEGFKDPCQAGYVITRVFLLVGWFICRITNNFGQTFMDGLKLGEIQDC